MSVLAQVSAARVQQRAAARGPLSWLIDVDFRVPEWEQLVAEVRQAAAAEIWEWYHEHEQDVVLKVRVVFWSKEVRLGQIRHIIVAIAGEEPVPSQTGGQP